MVNIVKMEGKVPSLSWLQLVFIGHLLLTVFSHESD